MFALSARRLGYRVHAFDPQPDSPAGQVSDKQVVAAYDDLDTVRTFAAGVSVVSFEFENVPRAAAEAAAEHCLVRPAPEILHVCQNREREKRFLAARGFPCAPFEVVHSETELANALGRLGPSAILKTADFGYDGKGQVVADSAGVWHKLGASRGVLEARVDFETELSVLVARGTDGSLRTFPAIENLHRNHILELSIVPGRLDEAARRRAAALAAAVAETLGLVGLLAVEMFLCRDGQILINELAPRPHNSGHSSLDACLTSQFEQQLRAVCGLPLGSTDLLAPAVMWNLLGHLWRNGEPDWSLVLREPLARLHLYGKAEARPGRKMGHVTVVGPTDEALATITRIRDRLDDNP
jgi:5-(carboxyamino)imidazole ribonucleotide synthase